MKNLESFRILYVLRDEDDCKFINAILNLSNVRFVSTNSVEEALKRAETERFDLFLLETRLPDGDGFDLCRSIKSLLPNAPVIFYTGDATNGCRQKGLTAGATSYFIKPYLDELITALREVISRPKKPTIAANLLFQSIVSAKFTMIA